MKLIDILKTEKPNYEWDTFKKTKNCKLVSCKEYLCNNMRYRCFERGELLDIDMTPVTKWNGKTRIMWVWNEIADLTTALVLYIVPESNNPEKPVIAIRGDACTPISYTYCAEIKGKNVKIE